MFFHLLNDPVLNLSPVSDRTLQLEKGRCVCGYTQNGHDSLLKSEVFSLTSNL